MTGDRRVAAAPGGAEMRPGVSERLEGHTWLLPVGLFVAALAIRLMVAAEVPFPITEGSAYYVGVAGNIVAGEGLVSDAVWSFATPPLEVPKPAFELWLPMTSFLAALAMAILGPTFQAAQVGGLLLGALLAPLAWGVAREAARAHGLDARRSIGVSLASGLLVAVLGPFVIASVVPDSFTPSAVFSVAAALVAARVLGTGRSEHMSPQAGPTLLAALGTGALLGLAYLSRQEAVWLGLAVLLWALARRRDDPAGWRALGWRMIPVIGGGLCVVGPWLWRNAVALGSPLPGQTLENVLLRQNEDIYAFLDRPDVAGFLAQGPGVLLGNILTAAWDGLVDVLVVPAFPVGLAGLLALVFLRRSPALRQPTGLALLLLAGVLTYASTTILFPVATRWGTFQHASGPLLVALAVLAAMGADAFVARVSAWRRWHRPNVILAPIALLSVAALLGLLHVRLAASDATRLSERYAALAASLAEAARSTGGTVPEVLITDRPMWLSMTLGRSAVALPDESVEAVAELAERFGASWLVVVDGRGRYPAALLGAPGRACLVDEPMALSMGGASAWLFILDPACAPGDGPRAAPASAYTPRHMDAGSLDALWAADAGMSPGSSGPTTTHASRRPSAPTPPAVNQPVASATHPRVLDPRERSHA